MSAESNAPAWIQAGAAILALAVTSGTYWADARARRRARREDDLRELRRAAFDALSQAREWLESVKEAQQISYENFDWINDHEANHYAGVVAAALDFNRHHILPGGRDIVPLQTTGADFYKAISLASGFLREWYNNPSEVTIDAHHCEKTRLLNSWFAQIRPPLEAAVDGMEKIVNAMLRKWE